MTHEWGWEVGDVRSANDPSVPSHLNHDPGVPLCWFRPGVPPSHDIYSPRVPPPVEEPAFCVFAALAAAIATPSSLCLAVTVSFLPPLLLPLSSPPKPLRPRPGSGGGDVYGDSER